MPFHLKITFLAIAAILAILEHLDLGFPIFVKIFIPRKTERQLIRILPLSLNKKDSKLTETFCYWYEFSLQHQVWVAEKINVTACNSVRSSQVVRASDSQCRSPSILRHSGI